MTHCTSFFQMSSGRKAKFSTATTSSGTNGMLFFLPAAEHLGRQLQYHCRDRNYLHSQLSIGNLCSLSKVKSFIFDILKLQIRIFQNAYYDLVILHSTSTLLYIMFPMGRIWKFQQGLLRIRDLYDSLENHSSCCIQNGK